MNIYYVYILECAVGTYYTGVTNNLEHCFTGHTHGLNQRSYTHNRRPVKLF